MFKKKTEALRRFLGLGRATVILRRDSDQDIDAIYGYVSVQRDGEAVLSLLRRVEGTRCALAFTKQEALELGEVLSAWARTQ